MGWLSKILGITPKEKRKSLELKGNFAWEVSAPKDYARIVESLDIILPTEAVLYLEGSPDDDVKQFLESSNAKQTQQKMALNILEFEISTKSDCYHLPATLENIKKLANFFDNKAVPQICDHLHAYDASGVIMLWYDMLDDPIQFSETVTKETVKEFCDATANAYKEHKEQITIYIY